MKMVTLTGQKLKNQKREQTIKKKTRFHIIRISPDKENFDSDDEIRKIQDFIYESGIRLGEQSAKNKIVEDSEKLNKMIKKLCV